MARYPRRFGSPAARAQSRAAFTALGGFLPVLGAALSSVIESNTVTLSGLVGSPALTISGGQYSKNGAAYSSAATTVTNGDTLKLRVTSSASAGATASVVVTIDGTTRSFSVTTAVADTGTPTPTPTPGVTYNLLAANRTQLPTDKVSVSAGFTSLREHYAHADGDVTDLQFVDVNFMLSGQSAVGTGSSLRISKFVEYPAGTFWPVTWGGVDNVSIANGFTAKSDPVAGLRITKGAWWGERTVILDANSNCPVMVLPASSVALGVKDGNSASNLGNSGTINPTSGTNTIGAAAVIGTIQAANARSFLFVGDSLVLGQGDIAGTGAKGSSGWLARGLADYPYMKIAIGGQSTAGAKAVAGLAAIGRLMAALGDGFATDVIVENVVNDLTLGRQQVDILADQQSIYSAYAGYLPRARKWQTTSTTRTNSTSGNWSSAADQTVRTDGNMAALNSVNSAIRLKPDQLYGVIDAADFDMTARDSGIHDGPYPCTVDSTHFTGPKADAMGQRLPSALALAA